MENPKKLIEEAQAVLLKLRAAEIVEIADKEAGLSAKVQELERQNHDLANKAAAYTQVKEKLDKNKELVKGLYDRIEDLLAENQELREEASQDNSQVDDSDDEKSESNNDVNKLDYMKPMSGDPYGDNDLPDCCDDEYTDYYDDDTFLDDNSDCY